MRRDSVEKMKTLDEVIEELHYWDTCDEFPESFYDFEVTTDALHYLKEYQRMKSMPLTARLIDVLREVSERSV